MIGKRSRRKIGETTGENSELRQIGYLCIMPKQKSSMGPIWAVVIAGALLLVLVQLLPEKESAQKLAHFFIAIALIVALLMGFKDFRKDKEEE